MWVELEGFEIVGGVEARVDSGAGFFAADPSRRAATIAPRGHDFQ
jgi:hypothetical protein